MSTNSPAPTDPDRELELGRIAVWLDPEDATYAERQLARIDAVSDEDSERLGRIRFRLLAAVHKAGRPNDSSP